MNLQQLRYLCEVARNGLNMSLAASSLNTSQPGISKQIRQLEIELGVEIFERSRNRVSGITAIGKHVVALAQDVVSQVNHIRSVAHDFGRDTSGALIVATSHTQARYVLPKVLEQFTRRYPGVDLTLRQGDPEQIAEMVMAGEADLGVTTETYRKDPGLALLPCRKFQRVVVVPAGHPLLKLKSITLAAVAQYPLVAYEKAYTGRRLVVEAFEREGLSPKIVLSGTDADVIKACVEHSIGVAILSEVTFDPKRDPALRAVPLGNLVQPSFTTLAIRRPRRLRAYEYDFILMCSPHWTRSRVDKALAQAVPSRTSRTVI
ncbi:LysR substrate-binding domain-containing protein [Rhodopila sp.]|jgi:LysR family cys regulon transcriptional activator|uniref:LysR substrate-binding domain-containing protein n=1 Tax=Rhodopila sp. TaxID=2480087 RepID=UPI002B73FF7F|nr:LysR substrate-binding domain-containing protein [Rhodopila sp.]HVZ06710.1 LysR substrate-binding domain-containing protein [Rhodopila sp.]